MALTNKHFDATPKLRSSPERILFIPFNNEKSKCNCGNTFSITLSYKQKYCKICLSSYIKSVIDNNTYLDVHVNTNGDANCIEHKETRNTDFSTRNIREWCETCSEISHFKNYYNHLNTNTDQYIFMPEDCKLGIGIDSNFENRFQNRLIATNRFERFDLEIRFSVLINRF